MELDLQLFETSATPREISTRTGIDPDAQSMQGERNSALNLPRQNPWSMRSRIESDEVTYHWADIEGDLQLANEELRETVSTKTAMPTLVIPRSERLPSIQSPPAVSAFAGFVNAMIDIDHLR